MKFFDPVSLAKLANMHIRAKSVVEGLLSGLHNSPYKGHSLEFSQHREYSYGDELRHIDWKVFGRSDKFFIKQFQDETNLRGYILLDASGSMNFASSGHITKLDYAKFLAASLAYLFLHQEDSASLSAFDSGLRFYLPPRHQLSHLSVIFDKLEELSSGGETEIENVLKLFGQYLKKRGLIIFISDLLADPQNVLKALKYLRFRHHEIIVLQVLDPSEVKFPFLGDNLFIHLENEKEIFADADTLRAEYIKLFKQFLDEYKTGFRKADIDYYLITTDTPVEIALGQCLSNRS
ncbi:MAG: DUF58 domain-containing protein [Elusimicrobia bacterium]|nr:DUF58 domain-containing protein [Candidatus Liberimonas magnetica]